MFTLFFVDFFDFLKRETCRTSGIFGGGGGKCRFFKPLKTPENGLFCPFFPCCFRRFGAFFSAVSISNRTPRRHQQTKVRLQRQFFPSRLSCRPQYSLKARRSFLHIDTAPIYYIYSAVVLLTYLNVLKVLKPKIMRKRLPTGRSTITQGIFSRSGKNGKDLIFRK